MVAYVAAIASKEPYSVLARFWPWPKLWKDEYIHFIYDNPGMSDAINAVRTNNNMPEGARNEAKKIGNVNDLWKEIMRKAHKKVKTAKDQPWPPIPGPEIKFRMDEPNSQDQAWVDGHKCLGSHPQGFYTVWVTSAHYQLMKGSNYIRNGGKDTTWLFPDLSQADNLPTFPDCDWVGTKTTITQARITTAAGWPRCKTQNAVMGNVSAPEVS